MAELKDVVRIALPRRDWQCLMSMIATGDKEVQFRSMKLRGWTPEAVESAVAGLALQYAASASDDELKYIGEDGLNYMRAKVV